MTNGDRLKYVRKVKLLKDKKVQLALKSERKRKRILQMCCKEYNLHVLTMRHARKYLTSRGGGRMLISCFNSPV